MSTTMKDMYSKGNVRGLLAKFKNDVEQAADELEQDPENPRLLLHGPLVKSKYTYDLEKLFRHILYNDVKIQKNNKGEFVAVVYINGKVIEQINISETIKYANPNHVVFAPADERRYIQYTKNISGVKPNEAGMKKGVIKIPTREYFKRKDPGNELANLDYSEKLAINIYTTGFYPKMNEFLRGTIDFDKTKPPNEQEQQLKDCIVHSMMAISGLNKVANSEITSTFRNEIIYSEIVNQERIKKATDPTVESGPVTLERGFISTAFDEPSAIKSNPDVAITFSGLIGKNIKALSAFPSEKEYLIPPTQVSWESHIVEDGVHYFHAKPVSTLTGLSAEAMIAPSNLPNQDLDSESISFKFQVHNVLKMVIDIEADYNIQEKKFSQNPARKMQIANLIKKASELLHGNLPTGEKLKAITETLENTKFQLATEKRGFLGFFKSESRLGKSINKIMNEVPDVSEPSDSKPKKTI